MIGDGFVYIPNLPILVEEDGGFGDAVPVREEADGTEDVTEFWRGDRAPDRPLTSGCVLGELGVGSWLLDSALLGFDCSTGTRLCWFCGARL